MAISWSRSLLCVLDGFQILQRRSIAELLILFLSSGFALAQTNSTPAYIHHIARDPSTQQSVEGGSWRMDAGFVPTLRLKNILLHQAITATPSLVMADGTSYPLPPIKLSPAGTATLNIADAVENLPAGAGSHLSDFGMVAIDYQWSWPAVLATVQNLNEVAMLTTHSAVQGNKARFEPGDRKVQLQDIEAAWWRPYSTTAMSLFLGNTSEGPLQVGVTLRGGLGQTLVTKPVVLPAHSSQRLDLRALLGSATDTAGSLSLTYTGPQQSLAAVADLEDAANGFSATLHMMEQHPELARSKSIHQVQVAAPGVLMGAPKPKMHFPVGTSFTPYLVLHNVSSNPRQVALTGTYFVGGDRSITTPISSNIPSNGTVIADLKGLLSQLPATIDNESIELEEQFVGNDGDIESEVGSVDQTGNYVFEAEAQLEAYTQSRTICYWSTWDDTNTMISLWNYSEAEQDVLLTFHYEGGEYLLPLSLPAGGADELDVASIIRNQIPDKNGHVIPTNIHEGSATLSQLDNPVGKIYVASTTSSFNVRNGTCTNACGTCNGVVDGALFGEPIVFSYQSSGQLTGNVTYSNGYQAQYTTDAFWQMASQSANSVSSTGMFSATAVQSQTVQFIVDGLTAVSGYLCTGNSFYCPTGSEGGEGPVSSPPTVSINQPATTTITAGAVDSGGAALQYSFTAVGSPTGGTYSWTSSDGSVAPTNTSSATVSATGSSAGTPSLTVTYSLNGQQATAQQQITVLKADRLVVVNDTSSSVDCGGGTFCILRVIGYEIRSGSTPITDPLFMKENVPDTRDSCSVSVNTGNQGFVNSQVQPKVTYRFNDNLFDPSFLGTECHFSFSNQSWQQRNADGSYGTIATIGSVTVRSFSNATVAGNNTSLTGTTFQ